VLLHAYGLQPRLEYVICAAPARQTPVQRPAAAYAPSVGMYFFAVILSISFR
jgi:hypothetical protein